MLLIIFMKLKNVFRYVLTLIQNAINFGCITIEKVGKQDYDIAIGDILKIILMTIRFVGTIIKKQFFSKIVGLSRDICLFS